VHKSDRATFGQTMSPSVIIMIGVDSLFEIYRVVDSRCLRLEDIQGPVPEAALKCNDGLTMSCFLSGNHELQNHGLQLLARNSRRRPATLRLRPPREILARLRGEPRHVGSHDLAQALAYQRRAGSLIVVSRKNLEELRDEMLDVFEVRQGNALLNMAP
jgi:hypothetical protein